MRKITFEIRREIEKMLSLSISGAQIARNLNLAKSTIFYELQRCPRNHYSAEAAHAAERVAGRFRPPWKIKEDIIYGLDERLKNIESQIEILFDILKETK